MKLKALIKTLQKLESKVKGNPEVVVDFDANGYYYMEKAQIIVDKNETNPELSTTYINLKSSNET
jgi:hypothetical protein